MVLVMQSDMAEDAVDIGDERVGFRIQQAIHAGEQDHAAHPGEFRHLHRDGPSARSRVPSSDLVRMPVPALMRVRSECMALTDPPV
jgi:hypothetical protein